MRRRLAIVAPFGMAVAALGSAHALVPPPTPNHAGHCNRFAHSPDGNVMEGMCYSKMAGDAVPRGDKKAIAAACASLIDCAPKSPSNLGACEVARATCRGLSTNECNATGANADIENGACRAWQAECTTAKSAAEADACRTVQRLWGDALRAVADTKPLSAPELAVVAKAKAAGLGGPRTESPRPVQTPAPKNTGLWQAYERGWVYWSPKTQAHVVNGAIFARWAALRWEQGPLGFPASDELACATPNARDRYQIFEGGRLYWDSVKQRTFVLPPTSTLGDGGKCVDAAPKPKLPQIVSTPAIVPPPVRPRDPNGFDGKDGGELAFKNGDFESAPTTDWISGFGPVKNDAQMRHCSPPVSNVPSSKIRIAGKPVVPADLGGDFWNVQFPADRSIGAQGRCYVTGDKLIDLKSPEFTAKKRYLSFLARARSTGTRVAVEGGGAILASLEIPVTPGMRPYVIDLNAIDATKRKAPLRVVLPAAPRASFTVDVDDFMLTATQPTVPVTVMNDYAPTEVWGYADLHVHAVNHLGFGGMDWDANDAWGHKGAPRNTFIHGEPDGPIDHALRPCPFLHGAVNPSPGSSVFGVLGGGSLVTVSLAMDATENGFVMLGGHNGDGYPYFDGWPRFSTVVHQQMYVDWLKRAWQSGLRLMVAQAGSNELLAFLFGNRGPWDDQTVSRRLVPKMKELVGRHTDFMEVAYSPADARRIAGQGKLAVVLGIEVDALANCYKADGVDCSDAKIRAELDSFYDEGVRHVFLIAHMDNAFGGSAMYDEDFDVLNFWKRNALMMPDTNPPPDVERRFGVDHGKFFESIATGIYYDSYDAVSDAAHTGRNDIAPGKGHVNRCGMSRLGKRTFEYALSKGFIVDVDHMSQHSTEDALQIAERRHQPVAAGHQAIRALFWGKQYSSDDHKWPAESDHSDAHLRRVAALGGVIGVSPNSSDYKQAVGSHVPNDCPGSSNGFAQAYIHLARNVTGGRQIALGSDINGLNKLPNGRFGPMACLKINTTDGTKTGGFGGDDELRIAYERSRGLGPAIDVNMRDLGLPAGYATARALANKQQNAVTYNGRVTGYRTARWNYEQADFAALGFHWKGPYTTEEQEAWEAIAIYRSGTDPQRAKDVMPGLPRTDIQNNVVMNFAKGLFATTDEGPPLVDVFSYWSERRAGRRIAMEIRNEADHHADWNTALNAAGKYKALKAVWDRWQAMERGGNASAPLSKLVTASSSYTRDWDINVDGLAHIGMYPDFLQDVKNQLANTNGGTVKDLEGFFHGAEDYIRMWEKIDAGRGGTVGAYASDVECAQAR
jgi:microsomal dipeptidase-like Zn-dependent dipeptidase